MSDTQEPREVAEVAEEHQLAGRHHAALEALRPYFATGKLDPAEARDFVRHALNVSRVRREMGLAETAADLWAAILPGLAGGKSIPGNQAIAAARQRGVVAVEMEAAALYAFAVARRKTVLCVAHVTNRMGRVAGDFEKGEADGAADALTLIGLIGAALSDQVQSENSSRLSTSGT